MTDPVLGLETAQLTVEPGGQVRAEFTVLNPGTIVESYTLDVVGEQPIPWAEVLPPVLSVYPQQQETATVVFSPPAGPTGPGGTVPFGIRAKSQVDPSSSAVVEGQLEIGQVFGLQAKLTPVTSSGRWRGLHTIQFSNWGNAPARLRIVASDQDQALGFLIRPEVVDVPLGATVTARIKARTRKPVLRGSNSRLPFKVVGEPDPPRPLGTPEAPGADPGRPAVDGAFTQKPILSRGVVMAATVVGVALIGVLAFALTRGGPATTPAGDGVTVPAKPVLTATAAEPGTISLAWELLRNVDSYTLQYVDPATGRTNKTEPGLDVQQNAKNVDKLAPATKYCFKLRAINGKLAGPESEPACATTAKAALTASPGAPTSGGQTSGAPTQGGPTSGGPTGGGTTGAPTSGPPSTGGPTIGTGPDSPAFAAGQWIALVDSYPAGSGVAEQTARDLAARLKAGGVPAQVLNATGQYPGLTNTSRQPLRDAWVVYVGPAGAADQAATLCRSEAARKVFPGAACITFQPAQAGN
ncbi:fibronectin type III domain protein [Kribbella orskensis]|uniref:Fibronectin type III domain protein n=1 Tax=Kribbella orskensis TaxID=2512216 RepID=A0ABY2BBI8_9ACTN|nr:MULTISPECIES: fibronectin type III domain-containing protein [Kribbella]TCN34601.1 fibronectin type III domain protein [Kribbella sp. VKM Ac-2500]TCO14968.1 fibronectin type III domain protein [Kribbella orskensis]